MKMKIKVIIFLSIFYAALKVYPYIVGKKELQASNELWRRFMRRSTNG